MRFLTLIVLLTSPQLAYSLSQSERTCLALNVYHEARSLPKEWLKVATVAVNRSKDFKNYNYGSRSNNICDIIKSKQYTSSKFLRNRIKEQNKLKEIQKSIDKVTKFNYTNMLFFSSRKGKIYYKREF